MSSTPAGQRVFGILAGGGRLPLEIADSLHSRGAKVHIVAFRNEADADFAKFSVTWVSWGQVGAILRGFANAQCTDLIIVGRVSRPDLGRLRPDLGLFAALPSALRIVAAGGDDSVLRGVTKFFEGKGFCVVGPGDVAPELLREDGPLGANTTNAQDDRAIAYGLRLLEALSPFDVGQTVVISDDLKVEAIEGIEGTDAMLARVAQRRRSRHESDDVKRADVARNGFLIKAPKQGQDMRVDLPAIGPQTIKNAVEANLNGLALHAGHVLAADKKILTADADAQGLSVIGVQIPEFSGDMSVSATSNSDQPTTRMLGAISPGRDFVSDANRGAQVLHCIESFATGGAVIVTHGHVLGVETGEGVGAFCQRIARRKQWGRALWNRRRGTMVVRDVNDVTTAVIKDIARSGFSGFAVLSRNAAAILSKDVLAQAETEGISVGTVDVSKP